MDNQGSWGNPDVDRAVALKGEPTVTVRNPQVKKVVGGVQTELMGPNPTPTYRYLFHDGTYIDVELSYDTNGSTVLRKTAGGTALKDVAKAEKPDDKPPDIHTNPDGSQDIWNPTTRQYEPYKPAKQAAAKGPDLQTFPDGSQGHWDPAAKGGQGDWVIDFTKPQGPTQAESKPGTVPGLGNAPAERPGQLTNLDLVYAQANQFIAGVNAETNLSPQQRQAKIQAYLDGTVKPAAEQATREANAYAQQQQQRQQETAARAGRTEDRQTSTAERQTAVQEATQRLNEQKFSYDRGQDAVSNALKLLQYQVDPSFSPALAGVYNRIMPGAFQPNAFQTALPDIDAIAQAHIGPLLDMHASPVTGPTAQGAAALTAAQPGQVPGQPQPDPLANVPITPRAPYPQPGGTGIVGRFGQ